MNTYQPISIFEEEQELKKKYGVWAILALIYVFLLQTGITLLCGLGIWEESRTLLGTEGIIYILVQDKMLMACYGVTIPLLALAIRKIVGWVLMAIIPYFLLGLSMVGMYLLRFIAGPQLYILLGIMTGAAIFIVCINTRAVKRFYRVPRAGKMLLWNTMAIVGAIVWLVFLFHDYHS